MPSSTSGDGLCLLSLLFLDVSSFTVESAFPPHAPALIPPPSLAKMWFSFTFTLSHLTIWTDGSVPFPFGKDGSGVLTNYSLCGSKATFSFSTGPVCSSVSDEACAILQALCWSRQHQQACYLSSYLTLALSSAPFFLLPQSLWQICLLSPPLLSSYNGSPDTIPPG